MGLVGLLWGPARFPWVGVVHWSWGGFLHGCSPGDAGWSGLVVTEGKWMCVCVCVGGPPCAGIWQPGDPGV